MHFGEYLVQQKILSAHHVLKALAEQRRRRAFMPLLMVELGTLPDYRALQYCNLANQKCEEFLDVLVAEEIISRQQSTKLRINWMRSGPPLGRLLVEMGFIDEETRAVALHKFESTKALEGNTANSH